MMLGKHASGSIGSAVLYEGLVVRMIVRFSFGISQEQPLPEDCGGRTCIRRPNLECCALFALRAPPPAPALADRNRYKSQHYRRIIFWHPIWSAIDDSKSHIAMPACCLHVLQVV